MNPSTSSSLLKRPLLLAAILVPAIVILLIVVLLFSALSGSRKPKAAGPITLTVWALEDQSLYQQEINDFERANPNVKVVWVKQDPQHFRERISTQPQTGVIGSVPDVVVFHNTWTPEVKNFLVPLPDTIISGKDYAATYYPSAVADLTDTKSQQIYGLPISSDGLALYYNTDMFASRRLSPPKDWETFAQAAESLTTRDDSGITVSGAAIGTAKNISYFSDIIGTMLVQQNDTLTSLGDKNSDVPGVLDFYTSFATGQGKIWSSSLGNDIDAFALNKVAMIFGPATLASQLTAKNPQVHFATVQVPQLRQTNPKAWASYWAWGVSKFSPQPTLAWQLAWSFSEPNALILANQRRVALTGYGLPYPRQDLASRELRDPILGTFVVQATMSASLQMADQTFDYGADDGVSGAFTTAITNIVDLKHASSAEMQNLASTVQDVLTKLDI